MRIATRKSPLAIYQAELVKETIEKNYKNISCTLIPMISQGDELSGPLETHGGKGLFIGNLERALQENKADIAVHSLKDVPAILAEEFSIVATLPREDHREFFLSPNNLKLTSGPLKIGSSSPRRKAQLLHINSKHSITPIRGNINTRINAISELSLDGIMVARAALNRLNIKDLGYILDINEMMPSASQGAIGIEVLKSHYSDELRQIMETINCQNTFRATQIERIFVASMQGDCNSPMGCFCEVKDDVINFSYQLLSLDGSQQVTNTLHHHKDKFMQELEKEIEMLYSSGKQSIIYDH